MVSINKGLQMGAMMHALKEVEGSEGAHIARVEAIFNKFHRFEILDEVLSAFLDSNDGSLTLSQLLDMPANDKILSKFFHCSFPYLATVKMRKFKKLQLQIKLPNVGFVYKPKEGMPIARQSSETWIHLHNTFQYFPSLTGIAPNHTTAKFFYNFGAQRVDFILTSQLETIPDIMVTYEPAYPYIDDDPAYSEEIY